MNRSIKDEILDSIKKKELVLLCGAGISMDTPSNLPDAKNLVLEILKNLFKNEYRLDQFTNLRPEVVFQRIIEYNEIKFLSQLRKILETKLFNQNHLFAAHLLRLKLNVVTTNFDTLIENAADYLEILYSKSFTKKQKQPTVFKIHGCLEDNNSLTYAINQVNLGLAEWKQTFLLQLLKNKKVLVLGYSGLDQLDILPVLKNAQYKKIIWINHTNTGVKHAPNHWVKQLPRLSHINLNTGNFISIILKDLTNKQNTSIGLNKYESTLAYLELLEHQNRYKEILAFVKKSPYKNDLRVRVFELVSAGSSIKRVKNYKDLRESITNDVFTKASSAKNGLLTFMGDAANKPDHWQAIEKIFDRDLKKKSQNYYLIESILGYIAWLAHQNNFAKAHKYLKTIIPIIKKQGFLLLEARYAIAKGQILRKEFEHGITSKKDIHELNKNIDRAIFLVSNEIFNDIYFYYRAIIIKAFILTVQNKTKEAKVLLKKAINYFKEISVNNCIDAFYIYSLALLKEKNRPLSLKYINKAIALNRDSNRTYYLGNLLRKKALLIKSNKPKLAKSLLMESKITFENIHLFAEAKITSDIIKRL